MKKFILLLVLSCSMILAESVQKNYTVTDSVYLDSLAFYSFSLRGSDPIKGIRVANKALELAEDVNYSLAIMRLKGFIGVHYRNISDYETALIYYIESYNLADSLGNDLRRGFGLINIGNLYFLQKKDSLALKTVKEALVIAENLDNEDMMGYCYVNLGRIYLHQNKWDESLYYYNLSLEYRQKINDKYSIAQSLLEIAKVYQKQQKYRIALEYYRQAMNSSESAESEEELKAQIYNNIGSLYSDQQNLSKSNSFLQKALIIYQKIGQKTELANINRLLGDNYRELNDFESAVKYYDSARKYETEIYNLESNRIIAKLEIEYETEQKEKINELLRTQNQLNELTITNRTNLLLFSMIVIILLIILSALYFSKFKLNKKTNNVLITQNNQIETQRAELEKLNSTKDLFFTIIGHDLRNPFMNLINSSDLLLRDYDNLSEFDKKTLIESLNKSAKTNYKLLDNLLTWSRSQRGHIEFNPQKISISAKINEVSQQFQNSLLLKDITFLHEKDTNYIAYADGNMLRTILRNLISNAIKYSNEGGFISINCENTSDIIKINVKDNGVGIDEDQLESLFEINNKNSTKGTANEHGSGLGLIICKEFVEKNNGTIGVESSVGKGSTFYFTLPKFSTN